jgi:hypothetical protein
MLAGTALFGQSNETSNILTPQGAWYQLSLEYELGFAKVLANTIQIGEGNTNFNYVSQGGEEILFPFSRYQAELTLGKRNHVVFLYQPLLLSTQTRVPTGSSVIIDDVTFGGGTNLDATYSFPFWRLSYLYDVVSNERFVLGVGGSLQLRNASIRFANTDGSQLTVSQNLGPVPVLKVRARYDLPNGIFFEGVADGFYASSAFFNGASFSFTGSILDASMRTGVKLQRGAEAFISARFIGGTATGNSQYAGTNWSDARSTYTDNKLATLELTLGVTIR